MSFSFGAAVADGNAYCETAVGTGTDLGYIVKRYTKRTGDNTTTWTPARGITAADYLVVAGGGGGGGGADGGGGGAGGHRHQQPKRADTGLSQEVRLVQHQPLDTQGRYSI